MEATLAFSETNEKGITKEVKERYVVEAASFIDGEKKLRDELNYANRPIKSVAGMIRPKYGTICFSDDATAESFYKVKVVITEEVEVKTRKGGVAPRQRLCRISIWCKRQATRQHGGLLRKRSIRTQTQTTRLPTW